MNTHPSQYLVIPMIAQSNKHLFYFPIRKTRSGRKFQASFLLLNLSLALLGLNVTLLISEMPYIANPVNFDDIASSCIAIAAILHFFLLASCAWMNCEGATLCLAVIKVRGGSGRSDANFWGARVF